MSGGLGVWLVGARGGVATTVAVGLETLRREGAATLGLATEAPPLADCDLAPWDRLVIGGHEVRDGSLADAARALEQQNGALPAGAADRHAEALAAIDARIRPGVLFRSGEAIEAIADGRARATAATPREAIDRVAADLTAFREAEGLEAVVVVLLGSTEPPVDADEIPADWPALEATLDSPGRCPLRASSLYAVAALRSGCPVVNFTPSLGADCPAIEQLARESAVPHCGRDGKTGETLIKSALAPMFAARQLRVDSWVSHNLLGNRDGAVLADPTNKAAKVASKEESLERLLGYRPESLVSIEPIASLGDWKTAWDHVHFRGFLGVPMTLQFTWQGCDSALAAPLVLDLVRLIDLARRRGESGVVRELASFFKSPMGDAPHALAEQVRLIASWVRR